MNLQAGSNTLLLLMTKTSRLKRKRKNWRDIISLSAIKMYMRVSLQISSLLSKEFSIEVIISSSLTPVVLQSMKMCRKTLKNFNAKFGLLISNIIQLHVQLILVHELS